MKKLIVLSVIFFISISSSIFYFRPEAKAEDYPYARVVSPDACLYADFSLTMPRFIVPESYYVKVISAGSEVCRVSFMDGKTPPIEGYLKTISLSFVNKTPAEIYPDIQLVTVRDEVMFSELRNKTPRAVLSAGETACYYGELTLSGATYVYVYSAGCIGYVPKTAFSSFDVPFTDGYLLPTENPSSDKNSSSEDTEKSKSSDYDPGKIIIIAAALIAVVSVVFIVTRPQKQNSNAFYRDDD